MKTIYLVINVISNVFFASEYCLQNLYQKVILLMIFFLQTIKAYLLSFIVWEGLKSLFITNRGNWTCWKLKVQKLNFSPIVQFSFVLNLIIQLFFICLVVADEKLNTIILLNTKCEYCENVIKLDLWHVCYQSLSLS